MSKWKEIKTYTESESGSLTSNEFNITQDQARLILDIKKAELNKFQSLSMLDISKDEVKQLAKTDPTIVKAIGKQGGSFRTSMVKQRAGMMEQVNEVFSSGMMAKLKKSYEPMRGKKISPAQGQKLMGIMDKVDKNKNALIQLFKADIPFVSQLASTRLISKHNMKGKDINKLKEDAPTNSVASGGVDMNPTGLSKKKKELDARTKEYKIHARKLVAQREKRLKKKEMLKGSFTKGIKESMNDFSREEFIVEDNVAILRDIVKSKSARPLKFKDGQMKVDSYTASAFVQTLDKIKKKDTKSRLEFIINKGNKAQFLRTVDVVFSKTKRDVVFK